MSRIENFIVVYDISNNKNRTRLARFLFEYGVRTQYSVFEAEVKPKNYNKFVALLARKIKNPNDKIYIYPIDKSDLDGIKRIGNYENSIIYDFFV